MMSVRFLIIYIFLQENCRMLSKLGPLFFKIEISHAYDSDFNLKYLCLVELCASAAISILLLFSVIHGLNIILQ